VSRSGQYLARIAGPGDGAIRRRMDVTRLFTTHPGVLFTVHEVCKHTPGEATKVRALLAELAATGWLHSKRDESHRILYWREASGV
jgi:hypothetical protein